MQNEEHLQKGSFGVPGDMVIYVSSQVRHGSRLWTRYDLFSGKPSGGEPVTSIGFIESEKVLSLEEIEKRAKAVYERWVQK